MLEIVSFLVLILRSVNWIRLFTKYISLIKINLFAILSHPASSKPKHFLPSLMKIKMMIDSLLTSNMLKILSKTNFLINILIKTLNNPL